MAGFPNCYNFTPSSPNLPAFLPVNNLPKDVNHTTTPPVINHQNTTDPTKFMPADHTNTIQTANTTKPADNAADPSNHNSVIYLVSGIGALVFVVLVGICLCKRD